MPKRHRDDSDDDGPSPSTAATIGQVTSHIKNKIVRSEKYAKLLHKKKKAKKAERVKRQKEVQKAEELGLEGPQKRLPKTIESQRERDATWVEDGDEAVQLEEADDEFAAHFQREVSPKVLLTTSYSPTGAAYHFLADLMELFPHVEYYARRGFSLRRVLEAAASREYTDVLVMNADARVGCSALLHAHLPDGPTALYRVTNIKLSKDIKNHGRATKHKPELLLNNFNTRLGRRIGRMLACLFDQDPNFRGRRVVTFHNQRDFVFVRHHRYVFEEKEKREARTKEAKGAKGGRKAKARKAVAAASGSVVQARLQELGPRFTLRLQSLQKGLPHTGLAEFEWLKTKDKTKSRRKFSL